MNHSAGPASEPTLRIDAIVEELEMRAAAGESPSAVLQSGAEVAECARLSANRSALYLIASGLLRASMHPGVRVDLGKVFARDSEYYLTDVEYRAQPMIKPEAPDGASLRLGNKLLGIGLLLIAILALIGAAAILRSIF